MDFGQLISLLGAAQVLSAFIAAFKRTFGCTPGKL